MLSEEWQGRNLKGIEFEVGVVEDGSKCEATALNGSRLGERSNFLFPESQLPGDFPNRVRRTPVQGKNTLNRVRNGPVAVVLVTAECFVRRFCPNIHTIVSKDGCSYCQLG